MKKEQKNKKIKRNRIKRRLGRMVTGGYYDHQKTRIALSHRIRDIVYRIDKDIGLNEVQDKKEEKKKPGKEYNDANLPDKLEELKKEGKLNKDEIEYIQNIMDVQKQSKQEEEKYKTLMAEFLEDEEIYQVFLKHLRGISGVLSANLLKIFGYCEKAPYCSSMWAYSGIAPSDKGRLPKKKKGKKLNYNPDAKKLTWKIADSFMKQRSPIYRGIYDEEKAKHAKRKELVDKAKNQGKEIVVEEVEDAITDEGKPKIIPGTFTVDEKGDKELLFKGTAPKNKKHMHTRALIKVGKIFLSHYWECAKELSGQEAPDPFPHAKMGHKQKIDWKDVRDEHIRIKKKKKQKK